MANTVTLSGRTSSSRKIDEVHLSGRSAAASLPSALTSIEERLICGNLDSTAALALIAEAVANVPGISGAMIALREGIDVVCCASSGSAPPIGTRTDSASGLCGECLVSGRMVRSEEFAANSQMEIPNHGSGSCSAIIIPLPHGSGILGIFSATSQGNEHLTAFGTAATLAGIIAVEEKKRVAKLEHTVVAQCRSKPDPLPIEKVSMPDVGLTRAGVDDDLSERLQGIRRLALMRTHQGNSAPVVNRQNLRSNLSCIALLVVLVAICLVGAFAYAVRWNHKPASPVSVAPLSHLAPTVNVVAGVPTLAGVNHRTNPNRISGGKLLQETALIYPQPALANRIQGDVFAILVVDETGVVLDVLISSGNPTLAQSAVGPLSHWRYSPFKVGGRPVKANVPVTISFRLDREAQ